jgi:hypothetical protein
MTAGTNEVLNFIRNSVSEWPHTIALDRLEAALSIAHAQRQVKAADFNNAPPKIFYSSSPATLILVDGEPAFRAVAGTGYQRVLNTPALLLYDAEAGRYYLDGGSRWMTAKGLTGNWSVANEHPDELDQVKANLASDEKQPQAHIAFGSDVSRVYISTTPGVDSDPGSAPTRSRYGHTSSICHQHPMTSFLPAEIITSFSPADGIVPPHSMAPSSLSRTQSSAGIPIDPFRQREG